MTVRQMASLVHSSSATRRVLAVLRAYFDESGFGSSVVFAMGGYVATEDEWDKKFEGAWQKLLDSPLRYPNPHITNPVRLAKVSQPLKALHSTDMEGLGKGRFRHIGQDNRNYLVNASVDVILKSGILGIASAVLIPEYNRLSEREREEIGDPYLLCFQHVIAMVAEQARMFIGENPKEDIAYIFDQQAIWQHKANAMRIKSVERGCKTKYRMGSVTFADKEKFLPLQAADRHSFEVYQHFADRQARDIWGKLVKGSHHRGRYFDGEGFASLIEQMKKSGRLQT